MPCKRRGAAQALVESALVLPLVLTLSLGVLQVVLYAHAHTVLTSAAQEGARLAAEDGRGVDRIIPADDAASNSGTDDATALSNDPALGLRRDPARQRPAALEPRPQAGVRSRAGGRRWPVSPLTRRILAVNVLALALLAGGFLYLGKYQASLIGQQIESLKTQGEVFAAALGEGAVLDTVDEGEILAIDRADPLANCSVGRYELGQQAEMTRVLWNHEAPLQQAGAPVTHEPETPVAPRDIETDLPADLDSLDIHPSMRRQIGHYLDGAYPHVD